jgi:mono/diheme cytochrome c family protein
MKRLEIALGVLLVAVVVAHLSLRSDHERRNVEFLPDMVSSPAYGSQAANPVFTDGKTMQAPPDGTVARGFLPLHAAGVPLDVTTPFKELPAEQVEAWNRLQPPWDWEKLDGPARADVLARGAFIYSNFCIVCHGPSGAGDGAVTKLGVPPPTPLTGDGAKEKSDGRLYRIVTCGEGSMASYATQVAREDRWNVIRYIRSLQSP